MAAFGRRVFRLRQRTVVIAAGAMVAGGLLIAAATLTGDRDARHRRAEPEGVTAGEQGAALLEIGAYNAAVKTLHAAYRIHPTAENRLKLARALHAVQDFYGVIAIVGEAPEPSLEMRLYRAEAYARIHDFTAAEHEAEALKAFPETQSAAAFILARVAYGRGEGDIAEALTMDVIRQSREHAREAWLFRARMALDANALKIATSAARRARETGAGEIATRALISEARFIRTGRPLEARRALGDPSHIRPVEKAGASDARPAPQEAYLRALIAVSLDEPHELVRMIELARPWLKFEPRGPLRLAALQWRAGDNAVARAGAADYLRRAPGDSVANDLLAAIALDRGDAERAMEIAGDIAARDPALGAYRLFEAHRQLENRDAAFALVLSASATEAPLKFATAIEFLLGTPFQDERRRGAYSQLVQIANAEADGVVCGAGQDGYGQRDAVLSAMIGARALTRRCEERAAAFLDEALATAPDFTAALEWRTLADIQRGDLAAAGARLEGRLTSRPDDLDAALFLARTEFLSGEAASARDRLGPFAPQLIERPEDALFYADLLSRGESRRLRDFARMALRRAPDAPVTADLLERAGLLEDAAGARRAAMLADPEDPARVDRYVDAMIALSRRSAARSLLAEIQSRRGSEAVAAALRRLTGAQGQRSDLVKASPPASPADRLLAARRAFEGDHRNPRAALAFARALEENGEAAAGAFRIACFRGSPEACQALRESDS